MHNLSDKFWWKNVADGDVMVFFWASSKTSCRWQVDDRWSRWRRSGAVQGRRLLFWREFPPLWVPGFPCDADSSLWFLRFLDEHLELASDIEKVVGPRRTRNWNSCILGLFFVVSPLKLETTSSAHGDNPGGKADNLEGNLCASYVRSCSRDIKQKMASLASAMEQAEHQCRCLVETHSSLLEENAALKVSVSPTHTKASSYLRSSERYSLPPERPRPFLVGLFSFILTIFIISNGRASWFWRMSFLQWK